MKSQSPTCLSHISALLTRSHRQLTARLTAELKPVGISIDMWLVLGLLSEKAGRSMTEISGCLSLNLPTATKLVDRMVSDNLVYRRAHNKDRRRVMIFASDRGISIFSEAQRISEEFERTLGDEIRNMGTLKEELDILIG